MLADCLKKFANSSGDQSVLYPAIAGAFSPRPELDSPGLAFVGILVSLIPGRAVITRSIPTDKSFNFSVTGPTPFCTRMSMAWVVAVCASRMAT